MIITKYEHACFTVEYNNQVLVVDPGNLSDDFVAVAAISAIIITHEHADHFDPSQLAAIFTASPNSILVSTKDIISKIPDHPSRAVQPGDMITVGAFELAFFGGQHAEIHPSIPMITNLGVLINQTIYYPGDSLTLPGQPIDTLALPAAAPWAKIGEIIDFLVAAKPRFAFPTHDAILSPRGQVITDGMLTNQAIAIGTTYQRIDTEPYEVA